MRSEQIILYKKGFNPLTIRRWNYEDGSRCYDILCHTYLNGDTRWQKLLLSNEEVEKQIEMYKEPI